MPEILGEKKTLPRGVCHNVIKATLNKLNRWEEENHKFIELVDKIKSMDIDGSMVFDFSPFYTDGPVIKLSAGFIKTLKENGSIFSKEDVDNFRSILRSFHKVLEDNGLSPVNDYDIAKILGLRSNLWENERDKSSLFTMETERPFHLTEDENPGNKSTLFLK